MSLHYVGEVFSGGMVIHSYHVNELDEECILVSLIDISSGVSWSNVTDISSSATSIWDGFDNTEKIINQSGHTTSAAKVVKNYDDGNWYLPSIKEIQMINENLWVINQALSKDINYEEILGEEYWVSTEYNQYNAYHIDFSGGWIQYSKNKNQTARVRAVKKVPG